MRVRRLADLPARRVKGMTGVHARGVGPAGPARLKHFVIGAGIATPMHEHPQCHVVVLLSGTGVVRSVRGEREIGCDDVITTAPHESYAFGAGAREPLEFLWLDAPGNS